MVDGFVEGVDKELELGDALLQAGDLDREFGRPAAQFVCVPLEGLGASVEPVEVWCDALHQIAVGAAQPEAGSEREKSGVERCERADGYEDGVHGTHDFFTVAGLRSLYKLGAFVKICFGDAGWSSLVARRAHNPKVAGSNPAPATTGSGLPEPFLFPRSGLCLSQRNRMICSVHSSDRRHP